MSDGLLHYLPDGETLCGAWTDRGSFYAGGDGDPEQQYAEAVMQDRVWAELLESLPSNAPYVASWERVELRPNETPEQLYKRMASE